MKDVLESVRGLIATNIGHEAELRASLLQLERTLNKSLAGTDVHVSSGHTVLDRYGDDESTYGYLSYDHGKLSVAYRSTEDDVMEYVHEDALDQTFSLKPIKECSFNWLRAVSRSAIIESFFAHLLRTLENQRNDAAAGITTVGQVLKAPVRDAEAALEAVAQELGYEDVIAAWRQAQASIYLDPRDAITRASSLVETVCHHILTSRGVSLPADKAIKGLLRPTLRLLHLAPEELASEDLRQMASGVISIVSGLGALRTHEGTAHGQRPGSRAPTQVEARFAVNLAGATSTFLMEAAVVSE